jgi:hypothetical protein
MIFKVVNMTQLAQDWTELQVLVNAGINLLGASSFK